MEEQTAGTIHPLHAGIAAGWGGTVVQTIVGKVQGALTLPPEENSHLAPRLMHRLSARAGHDLSQPAKWALGTVFHFGYGMTWGGLYALAAERLRPHPAAGGALLGALIYAITFPPWGGAVQTDAERRPRRRTPAMEALALSVTFSFGLATAFLYEKIGPRRS